MKREKRKPVICPHCHREMVCMNKFESIYNLIRGFYVWYVCPRRKKESGCGHSALLEISPQTKRPQRMITSVKFKKVARKRAIKR